MNPSSPATEPGANTVGETACGARIMISQDTPFIYYRDEIIYFCGEDCKFLYIEEPMNSCMAARLLSGK
jgi:hypothetical protein